MKKVNYNWLIDEINNLKNKDAELLKSHLFEFDNFINLSNYKIESSHEIIHKVESNLKKLKEIIESYELKLKIEQEIGESEIFNEVKNTVEKLPVNFTVDSHLINRTLKDHKEEKFLNRKKCIHDVIISAFI